MPAIEPSKPARGIQRVTASPKNASTSLSTPITTSAAIPSCQVAIAAACSPMPCALKPTNAGPNTSKAIPIDVGASKPKGIDRKSVGEGKGVSVRDDLGGRRCIKKKKKTKKNK